MKTGISTIALRKYDLFTAIDLAKKAGFDGVEIWGRPEHTPDEFNLDYWLKVKDKLAATGLEIANFGSYVNPASGDYEARRENAFKICNVLGATKMRVWCGNKEPKEADEALWEAMIAEYKELCKRAADAGITFAIEMHGGTLCVNPVGSLRIIESVNHPALKLNYQLQNPAKPGIQYDIQMVGKYVVNIHAQNHIVSPEDPTKTELTLIEDGATDYLEVLKLLKPYGFDGFIEVEFLKGEFDGEEAHMDSLYKDAAYLRKITDEAKKA